MTKSFLSAWTKKKKIEGTWLIHKKKKTDKKKKEEQGEDEEFAHC